jgi:histidine triad (HIT) family protein
MVDCIFCQIARRERESWTVYETAAAHAFLDINPVSDYHTLVIPKRHATDIFAVSEADLLGVMSAVKHVVDLYRSRLGITDLQVVSSSGAEAQQEVLHLHFHIVPRHTGDGQDVVWTRHPELYQRFDGQIARLHEQP